MSVMRRLPYSSIGTVLGSVRIYTCEFHNAPASFRRGNVATVSGENDPGWRVDLDCQQAIEERAVALQRNPQIFRRNVAAPIPGNLQGFHVTDRNRQEPSHGLLSCYVCATSLPMKQVTLREANQQFSKLVREVEETGERVLVLRNGKPAVEIAPTARRPMRKLTREQQTAVEAFLKAATTRPGNSRGERRWTRDELHER